MKRVPEQEEGENTQKGGQAGGVLAYMTDDVSGVWREHLGTTVTWRTEREEERKEASTG